jgi:hypothetical protein
MVSFPTIKIGVSTDTINFVLAVSFSNIFLNCRHPLWSKNFILQ